MAKEYLDYNGLSHFKDKLDNECNKRYDKLWSMGEQLIINGNGVLGNNTNFSALTFDPVVANASAGSFTREGHSYVLPQTDEYIPLFPNSKYVLSMDLKSDGTANTQIYAYLNFFDVDRNAILAYHHMYIENTLTTLSQDLKAGDTVVHFTDLTNWNVTTTYSHQHGFIFWNYTNRKGYTYPEQTYSRNVFINKYTDNSAVNKTNNTITLSSAWTGATIPAGTKVSQSNSGGNYKYAFYKGNLPATWANYSGYYDGVDYSGKNVTTKMPPGTAYAKLGFLWNYQSTGGQIWATNISLKAVEKDIVYTVDENKNVTFPAKVTASGDITSSANVSAPKFIGGLSVYPSSRPASANTRYGDGLLRYYLATSSMTTGKPPSDAQILHLAWDNTGGYDAQLAIGTTSHNTLYYRNMNGGTTWNAWKTVVTTDDLSAVATSGSYNDLTDKPTIPTVPTNVSAFTNDSGYITSAHEINNTRNIEYIVGTQTATTGAWTGVSEDTSLYDGKLILYFLPHPGSGNATLNLTLADGTQTGAIPIYLGSSGVNGTRMTTQLAVKTQGAPVLLAYDAKNNIWGAMQYWTDANTYDRTLLNDVRVKAGTNGIFNYGLVMQRPDGTWESLTTSGGTGGTKAKNTHGFLFDKVWRYNYSNNITSGNLTTNDYLYDCTQVDLRYSTNCNQTLTVNKPVYLVGTVNNDGLFYLDTPWWTQTLPSTEDGKVYIYLGDAYNAYCIYFVSKNTALYYKDGAIREYAYTPSSYMDTAITNAEIDAIVNGTSS